MSREPAQNAFPSVPADGDPLPDVGSASVFHDQAVLVAVPGNLGALLSSHSFCHLQGNSKTSGTDNAQVSTRVSGKTPQPQGNRDRELFPVSLTQIIALNFAHRGCATPTRAARVGGREALTAGSRPGARGTRVGGGEADTAWAGGLTEGIPGVKRACLRPLQIPKFLVWKSRPWVAHGSGGVCSLN